MYIDVIRRGTGFEVRELTGIRNVEPKLSLFTKSQNGKYTGLFGDTLIKREFDSVRDFRKFMDENEKFGVHGMDKPVIQFLSEYDDITTKKDDLLIYNIDIEVLASEMPTPQNAIHPITSICIEIVKTKSYKVLTLAKWDKANIHERLHDIKSKIDVITFDTEESLLRKFVAIMRVNKPHMITGWNINGFDIPYICARISNILTDTDVSSLSTFGKVDIIEGTDDFGKPSVKYQIRGLIQFDYLELYKKFILSHRPNYKLDTIGAIEVGHSKLEFDGTLSDLYHNDPQRYVDYNIMDTRLVGMIDDKLKLIDLGLYVMYYAKCMPNDIFGTVAVWDCILYNSLKKRDIVVPFKKSHTKASYGGGYVKDPRLGISEWVVSADYTSLYPKIIGQCNISPETLVHQEVFTEGVTENDFLDGTAKPRYSNHTVTPNGAYYINDIEGVIPHEINKVFNARKEAKSESKKLAKEAQKTGCPITLEKSKMLGIREQALKILINSLYGALGNIHFRYYNLVNAEAVTSYGRLSIKFVEKRFNEFLTQLN